MRKSSLHAPEGTNALTDLLQRAEAICWTFVLFVPSSSSRRLSTSLRVNPSSGAFDEADSSHMLAVVAPKCAYFLRRLRYQAPPFVVANGFDTDVRGIGRPCNRKAPVFHLTPLDSIL